MSYRHLRRCLPVLALLTAIGCATTRPSPVADDQPGTGGSGPVPSQVDEPATTGDDQSVVDEGGFSEIETPTIDSADGYDLNHHH